MSHALQSDMQEIQLKTRLSRALVSGKVALLRTYAKVFGPEAAARWLVSQMDWDGYRPGRPTVLCLSRPQFSKDIEQLRRRTNINWVAINNEFIGHVQKAWVPPEIAIEAHYQAARGPEFARYWQRLEEFGLILLKQIQSHCPIDAVMVSHIDYWHGEGVRLAAARLGIPFLALCREHLNLPHEQRTLRDFFTNFTFEGRAVAVFGEPTRRIFTASGACKPEDVWITGAPRLDIWREIPRRREPADLIVLLSYRDPDYFAPRSFREVLQIFVQAARRHEGTTDVRFLVKSKSRHDTQEIEGMMDGPPGNLEVDHRPALHEVFPRSRVTIGFNSLSIVEALLTDTTVVVPAWGDASSDESRLMFAPDNPVNRAAIQFAGSPSELAALLDSAATGSLANEIDQQQRLACVDGAIHVPDEQSASANVEAFVRHYVAESAANRQNTAI